MSPERRSQSGPEYLAQRHVLTYMEDALTQLLEHKDEVEPNSIAKFFSEYFSSVAQGTHVLFREFAFVRCTPHNRASFLRLFWRCFRTIAKNGGLIYAAALNKECPYLHQSVTPYLKNIHILEKFYQKPVKGPFTWADSCRQDKHRSTRLALLLDLLTMKEYQCLLQMLCPDFPMDLTEKAARIVLMDDAMDCLMSFSDFLYAFQIQFYYSEFLDSAAAIYQDLLTGKSINTVIVPTSRSATPSQLQPYGDAASLDGVEAPQFYQCLENICERDRHSTSPPLPLIGEILTSAPRLTFYGFLMALSKNAGINQSIGALPDKVDLLVDEVLDKELDRIVAQLSACSITHPTTSSLLPPSRDISRVASPKKTFRRSDLESDGSTEEIEDASEI